MNVNALHQVNRNLNQTLIDKNREIDRLTVQYNREVHTKLTLQETVTRIERENRNLLSEIENLERKSKELQDEMSQFKPPIHYKSYSELHSKSGKQRRRRECRVIFQNLLRNASDITHANISVKLGSDDVNYIWGKEQLHAIRGDNNVPNLQEFRDEEASDAESLDGTIVDVDGNFRSSFLKSIIYVMDKHKISHEAYHEIRMLTKGCMPPLHIIKKAKSKMSEEIDYIKHPTVCTC